MQFHISEIAYPQSAYLTVSTLAIWKAYKVNQSSRASSYSNRRDTAGTARLLRVPLYEVTQRRAGPLTQAKANDDSVTPFGKFLRLTSIDELP